MSNEDFIPDGNTFTNEGMAGDLGPAPDTDPFLDFYKSTNLGFVAYFTAI